MVTGDRKGNQDSVQEVELGKAPALTAITLADGKEYKLAPVDLNMLVSFEDAFKDEGASAGELIKTGKLKYVRYLLCLRLRGAGATLSEQEAGALVTLDVLNQVKRTLGV